VGWAREWERGREEEGGEEGEGGRVPEGEREGGEEGEIPGSGAPAQLGIGRRWPC